MIEQPSPVLTELVVSLAKMEKDRDRWRRALNDCTPGGSEFAGDPEFCKAYVWNVRSTLFEDVRKFALENKKFRALFEDSLKALRMVRNGTEGPEIKTLARDIVKQLEEFHVGRAKQVPEPRPQEALSNIARQERD